MSQISWLRGIGLGLLASVVASGAVHSIGIEDVVNGGNSYSWDRVELPGTQCSDGSQYKFFVYDSPSSTNMLVLFEGGGACWDYETCSGAAGLLGAANPNGIPDSYITDFKAKFVSPLVNGADPGLPLRPKNNIVTNGWDVVYLPYCTGDTHVGANVVTYTDPAGQNPPIVFRHMGFHNTREAMTHLAGRFPSINKLMVTGFSAGGVATIAAYNEVRRKLNPNKGYMLNDSGPVFVASNSSHNSRPLHELITSQWALQTLYDELPVSFDQNNFGSTTDMVATEFPNDQMAYTGYSSDFNFSRFSYERFKKTPRYTGLQSDGDLFRYQALSHLANDSNYTKVGRGDKFEAMTYDGTVFIGIQDDGDVFTYKSMADLAIDVNYTKIGRADNDITALLYNGSAYITIEHAGRTYSYPTLADLAANSNSTFLGTSDTDYDGILYDGSAYIAIEGDDGEVWSHSSLTGLATNSSYTKLGKSDSSYEALLYGPHIDKGEILQMWRDDQATLVSEMNDHSNFSYHIPWSRPINDSHVSTIITFMGSHACQSIRKRKWWELIFSLGQTWKCTSGFTPMEDFLETWVDDNGTSRILETPNDYNAEDPGMKIVAPLIDGALSGA